MKRICALSGTFGKRSGPEGPPPQAHAVRRVITSSSVQDFGRKRRPHRRRGKTSSTAPSGPLRVRVRISDAETGCRVEIIGGFLGDKAIPPLSVNATAGLRGRIIQWLNEKCEMHGVLLGTVYATSVSRRHPECRSCRGNGIIHKSASPICFECGGAGGVFPGFTEAAP